MTQRRLWLIADASEAAAIGRSSIPLEHWPGLDISGLGYSDLGRLWGVLRDRDGEEFYQEMMGKDLCFARRPGAETMVSAVPQEFVVALAKIAPERIEYVAEDWGRLLADDDVGPMGGRTSIVGWVRRLSEFAPVAQDHGKPVLELLEA